MEQYHKADSLSSVWMEWRLMDPNNDIQNTFNFSKAPVHCMNVDKARQAEY